MVGQCVPVFYLDKRLCTGELTKLLFDSGELKFLCNLIVQFNGNAYCIRELDSLQFLVGELRKCPSDNISCEHHNKGSVRGSGLLQHAIHSI